MLRVNLKKNTWKKMSEIFLSVARRKVHEKSKKKKEKKGEKRRKKEKNGKKRDERKKIVTTGGFEPGSSTSRTVCSTN